MDNETTESTNINDTTVEQPVDNVVPKRDEKGRLLPGYTANKNGRPKKKRFEDYFTEEEKEDLINKLKSSDKPDIWYKIAEMIFGKAKQPLVGGDEEDNAIQVEISEKIAGKRKLYDLDGITEQNS